MEIPGGKKNKRQKQKGGTERSGRQNGGVKEGVKWRLLFRRVLLR